MGRVIDPYPTGPEPPRPSLLPVLGQKNVQSIGTRQTHCDFQSQFAATPVYFDHQLLCVLNVFPYPVVASVDVALHGGSLLS